MKILRLLPRKLSDHPRLLDLGADGPHPVDVGDFSGKQEPTPKYGDPASIGGSYIVDCLKNGAQTSGRIRIVTPEEIDQPRARLA